ncbi:hypothetical protein GCM10025872_30530 [Barrientosiimonas endolithica]|uniref:Uncharacterized protein n=1 Tax=Barrientosiimonas endolithica TaxID=1535208 RepID=A0ABN6YQY6_9MICO|nr:hypothetical protein GCM10025872_30530 [Barrientosiimonas endolithica]
MRRPVGADRGNAPTGLRPKALRPNRGFGAGGGSQGEETAATCTTLALPGVFLRPLQGWKKFVSRVVVGVGRLNLLSRRGRATYRAGTRERRWSRSEFFKDA